MPIYEYRCPNGHTFELFHRMSDPSPEACETCGAGPVEKVLFPVAVHYKGSGFYSTDYGRGSRKGAKEGDGGSGETKGGSSEGSTSSTSSGDSSGSSSAGSAGGSSGSSGSSGSDSSGGRSSSSSSD